MTSGTGVTTEQVTALLAEPELLAAAAPGDLAVATRLRQRWPAELVAAATAQAELRARAAGKFDRAAAMLFTRPGLEQATALPLAQVAAERLVASATDRIVDLCCGIGGDTVALARATAGHGQGAAVVAVDRDPVHALLARHNTAAYDVEAVPVVADVTAALRLRPADTVHIDPARRDPAATGPHGRRGGYSPDLAWCTSLPAEQICVKVAPGITAAERPAGWETEWLSTQRELKLALLWSPAIAGATSRATIVAGDGSVHSRAAVPGLVAPVRDPGEWVIDPDPAVTRAGAVADLATDIDGWLIDPRIGFVCVDRHPETVWGRVLQVVASLPFAERSVAAELRRLEATDLQIRRRGLAGDVEALRRRLLKPARRAAGAGQRVTLLLTRHHDEPWALLCVDPPTPLPSVPPH